MLAQQCRPLNTCVYAHWLHSEKYSHCQAEVSEFNVTAVDAAAKQQVRNYRNPCTHTSEETETARKTILFQFNGTEDRTCLQTNLAEM